MVTTGFVNIVETDLAFSLLDKTKIEKLENIFGSLKDLWVRFMYTNA